MIVVDDHHLLDLLSADPIPELSQRIAQGVATTSSWYYRLSRAMTSGATSGSLSRRLHELPAFRQQELQAKLTELPQWITLVETRLLVPVMSWCARRTPSNFLTIEAVSTALVLDAAVIVSVASPQIDRVAREHEIAVELAAP